MHDLPAYLRRVGVDGELRPDLATLRRLAMQHPRSIPFENLDAFTGKRVSLDPVEVERKLVQQRRGGWCFEQNLLLGNALRALGFAVTDLAGRVVWGQAPDAAVPRTHRVLLVEVEGRRWIADAGFGGMTLTDVLDLDDDGPQQTPHGQFRLAHRGADYLLEVLLGGVWKPMFRLDLHPQQPIDFEAANFQLVHDPQSHFTKALRVSRVSENGRLALRDTELTFYPVQGEPRSEVLPDAEAVLCVLREHFELDAAAAPGLQGRLERQFAMGSAARS